MINELIEEFPQKNSKRYYHALQLLCPTHRSLHVSNTPYLSCVGEHATRDGGVEQCACDDDLEGSAALNSIIENLLLLLRCEDKWNTFVSGANFCYLKNGYLKKKRSTEINREESGGLSSLSVNWWRVLRHSLNSPLTRLFHSHLPSLLSEQLLQQVSLLGIVYLIADLCAFSIRSQKAEFQVPMLRTSFSTVYIPQRRP